MKTSPNTPQWAIDLVEKTCKDHTRALPGELKWNNRNRGFSSGSTSYTKSKDGRQLYIHKKGYGRVMYKGRIRIEAGTDEFDQKLVLLHELAHWVLGKNKSIGHLARFWRKAYELYELNGLDMDKAYDREKHYKTTAVVVYEQLYKGRS